MGEVGEPGLNGTDGRIGMPGMQVRIFFINLHCFNLLFIFYCSFFFYSSFQLVFFLLFMSTIHAYQCILVCSTVMVRCYCQTMQGPPGPEGVMGLRGRLGHPGDPVSQLLNLCDDVMMTSSFNFHRGLMEMMV